MKQNYPWDSEKPEIELDVVWMAVLALAAKTFDTTFAPYWKGTFYRLCFSVISVSVSEYNCTWVRVVENHDYHDLISGTQLHILYKFH